MNGCVEGQSASDHRIANIERVCRGHLVRNIFLNYFYEFVFLRENLNKTISLKTDVKLIYIFSNEVRHLIRVLWIREG